MSRAGVSIACSPAPPQTPTRCKRLKKCVTTSRDGDLAIGSQTIKFANQHLIPLLTKPVSFPILSVWQIRSKSYREPKSLKSPAYAAYRARQAHSGSHPCYDGILSFAQIRRLFFTSKSQAEQRLKFLYQYRYLACPNQEHKRLSEMVYWLDKKGRGLAASNA